jgi:hypothetical protein
VCVDRVGIKIPSGRSIPFRFVTANSCWTRLAQQHAHASAAQRLRSSPVLGNLPPLNRRGHPQRRPPLHNLISEG